MVAASLLLSLSDRRQLSVVVIAFATLLVALGLLAFGAILDAQTIDSSPVDRLLVGPFRWELGTFATA